MAEDRAQKELFEFKEPKRVFSGIGRIFPKNRFGVTLSIERLIFISISLIMIMVLLYALGVERGKSFAGRVPTAPSLTQNQIEPAAQKSFAPTMPKADEQPISAAPAPAKPKAAPAQAPDKPYTIVAATFSSRQMASAEVDRLRKEGFDAYLYQSDSYFQIRIGSYSNSQSAQTMLNRVRRRYKDAYLKLR